jgi:hypothetical protein
MRCGESLPSGGLFFSCQVHLRRGFDSLHPLQCLQGFSHIRRFLHQFCISLLPTA